MLFESKNNSHKLPNGELIGGYLAMKGIIKKIGKYLGEKLLKEYPYIGPFPLFIVPLGQSIYDTIRNNNGNYIAFNKCPLYYENTNCHYSQGCRCYCGHCCRCCTCNHNNINDPNLPFGAIGDKLKDWIKDFYNPFGKYEPIQSGLGSIDGNKGIYDCYFSDKNGYGFKFQMNCEQVPFPKNVSPKNGKVDIFEEIDKLKGNKTKLKPKNLELIHHERSYLNLIKHPNIVGLQDYFEDKKFIYLVTDYYSGGDLLSYIEKNHEISEKTAAKIVRKIAEGIKYLNIFFFFYRDIKPENILFAEENDIKSIKIIDLGVCQTLTYGQMANEPIGTNGYISPEIYMHKEYNFKTDIWSLGIILYLLITQGILPFDNDNMDNKVIGKKVIYLQQEYPEEYFGKCSITLKNLLDKMLDKNMEKRIDIISLLNDSWFNIIKKK